MMVPPLAVKKTWMIRELINIAPTIGDFKNLLLEMMNSLNLG